MANPPFLNYRIRATFERHRLGKHHAHPSSLFGGKRTPWQSTNLTDWKSQPYVARARLYNQCSRAI